MCCCMFESANHKCVLNRGRGIARFNIFNDPSKETALTRQNSQGSILIKPNWLTEKAIRLSPPASVIF